MQEPQELALQPPHPHLVRPVALEVQEAHPLPPEPLWALVDPAAPPALPLAPPMDLAAQEDPQPPLEPPSDLEALADPADPLQLLELPMDQEALVVPLQPLDPPLDLEAREDPMDPQQPPEPPTDLVALEALPLPQEHHLGLEDLAAQEVHQLVNFVLCLAHIFLTYPYVLDAFTIEKLPICSDLATLVRNYFSKGPDFGICITKPCGCVLKGSLICRPCVSSLGCRRWCQHRFRLRLR